MAKHPTHAALGAATLLLLTLASSPAAQGVADPPPMVVTAAWLAERLGDADLVPTDRKPDDRHAVPEIWEVTDLGNVDSGGKVRIVHLEQGQVAVVTDRFDPSDHFVRI